MNELRKLILAFIAGFAIMGVPYAHTLGQLSAVEHKLKITEQVACHNKSDYEKFLDVAPSPDRLVDTPDLWAQAKQNMLQDCLIN